MPVRSRTHPKIYRSLLFLMVNTMISCLGAENFFKIWSILFAHLNVLVPFSFTVTCANPATFSNAQSSPEKYDLIRVRTGGWSEFYVAFFTAHQKHQERRVYYQTAGDATETWWLCLSAWLAQDVGCLFAIYQFSDIYTSVYVCG